MAKYNELLVGRYNRFIQKLLSMKGPATLESINPELQVTLETFHGAENRYLEGWDRYGLSQSVAANAAQTAALLRNPKGSNVIAVLESIEATLQAVGGGAAQFVMGLLTTASDLAVTITPNRFDARGRPASSLILSSGTGTLGTTGMRQINTSTTAVFIQTLNQEIPLLPGDAVMVSQPLPLNTASFISICWRERFLEDSERA